MTKWVGDRLWRKLTFVIAIWRHIRSIFIIECDDVAATSHGLPRRIQHGRPFLMNCFHHRMCWRGSHVDSMWQWRGEDVATTWIQRGCHVDPTWWPHGSNVATTWIRHGCHVRSYPRGMANILWWTIWSLNSSQKSISWLPRVRRWW